VICVEVDVTDARSQCVFQNKMVSCPHLMMIPFFLCHSLLLPKLSSAAWLNIQGPFVKFVDSPYYSESELCGGVVMVSFLNYLPWQVIHFLQCSTHFSKMCCRPLITLKFLALELPFHGWKSPEITWEKI
jgi:hypothetical protein